MNQKQIVIMLVLVALLGGAGLIAYKKQGSSWSSGGSQVAGQKLLGDFQVNDVATIVIKQDTNEVNLVKKEDRWRVSERGDYPANFGEISRLLLKLREQKIVQAEKIGASQLARMELAAPGQGSNSATVVELRGSAGKALKSLRLGKKHMQKSSQPSQFGDDAGWPDGRYLMIEAFPDTLLLVSDALTEVEPKPEQWINKDFFKVEKPKTLSVTYPEATNSWQLTRETESGTWTLAAATAEEKLDSSKTSSLSYPFSSPTINDVAVGLTEEETGLNQPVVINVTTFDGFDYNVSVGNKTDDGYYVTLKVAGVFAGERTPGEEETPEDKERLDKEFADNLKKHEDKLANEKRFEKWTYVLASWSVDALLKKRHELLEEKKEETSGESTADEGAEATPATVEAVAD